MRELMEQYARIEKDMKEAVTSAKLGELEREGSLVIQEICLVAPRVHEAMMQTSRNRRYELTHSLVGEPVELGIRTKYEQSFEPVKKTVEEQNDLDNTILSYDTKKVKVNIVDKPKKKKTSKKKKAE